MSDAEPTVVDNPEAGRFEVYVDGELAGVSQYRRRGSVISFTHAEVDDRFEGRGLGSALVRGGLDAARAEGATVLPFCPFVRSYIERHPEYLDLVPPADRARFDLEGVR